MNVDPARRNRIDLISPARVANGPQYRMQMLLLRHVFDGLDRIAVELRTATHNRQSHAAIERLGAKLDGILRIHSRYANGALRDTCV